MELAQNMQAVSSGTYFPKEKLRKTATSAQPHHVFNESLEPSVHSKLAEAEISYNQTGDSRLAKHCEKEMMLEWSRFSSVCADDT